MPIHAAALPTRHGPGPASRFAKLAEVGGRPGASRALFRARPRVPPGDDLRMIPASRGAAAPSRHRRASSPGEEVVGGLFFDFEAVRTASRDRDAPRRQKRWTSSGACVGPRASCGSNTSRPTKSRARTVEICWNGTKGATTSSRVIGLGTTPNPHHSQATTSSARNGTTRATSAPGRMPVWLRGVGS